MSQEQMQTAVPLEANSPFEFRVNLSRDVSQSVVKQAIDSGDVGFLHSFTTGSTVDGPGVRVVGWTAGCQFRCRFCHNPDTWNLQNGMPVPLARAIDEVGKYRQGLKVMSGGLTLSGGEPLMQDRFVIRLFAAVRKMGIHTALDTNGFLGERLADNELENVDLVMLGMKAWDPERHRNLTGKNNEAVIAFARRLSARKRPCWLRYVLVPGLTDDEEDIGRLARFVADLGNFQRVDVLPFHQMGKFKWTELGLDYTLKDTEAPARELVQRVCAQFQAEGLTAY